MDLFQHARLLFFRFPCNFVVEPDCFTVMQSYAPVVHFMLLLIPYGTAIAKNYCGYGHNITA